MVIETLELEAGSAIELRSDGELESLVTVRQARPIIHRGASDAFEAALARRVIDAREPLLADGVSVPAPGGGASPADEGAALAVPIISRTGVHGAAVLYARSRDVFGEDAIPLALNIASVIGSATAADHQALLSLSQAAQALAVSPATVRRWANSASCGARARAAGIGASRSRTFGAFRPASSWRVCA